MKKVFFGLLATVMTFFASAQGSRTWADSLVFAHRTHADTTVTKPQYRTVPGTDPVQDAEFFVDKANIISLAVHVDEFADSLFYYEGYNKRQTFYPDLITDLPDGWIGIQRYLDVDGDGDYEVQSYVLQNPELILEIFVSIKQEGMIEWFWWSTTDEFYVPEP